MLIYLTRPEWDDKTVQFTEELERVLPQNIPFRDRVIDKADQHLRLILSANEYMNLTRITDPREAVIKHVYDCVAPWQHFQHAKRILDAGSGAGFPGVPLALVFPGVRFSLAESIQKKARFLDSAVESLELPNVHVYAQRAEDVARIQQVDVITARAVAPVGRIFELFRKFLKNGTRVLLYKGPDVASELAEAHENRVHAEVVCRYELPGGLGVRTLVELRKEHANRT